MPTRDIISALYGTLRLGLMDSRGMQFLDLSEQGFWRSFYAAALIAPFYGLLLVLRHQHGLESAPLPRLFSVEVITYVMAWVVFPLIMEPLLKLIDRDNKYVALIVAYNWSSIWQNLLYLPVSILGVAGIMDPETANGLGLILFGIIMTYSWVVIKTVLEVPALTATAIVVLDLTVAILINSISGSMLAQSPLP